MTRVFEAALSVIAVPWRQKGRTALIEAYSAKVMGWTIAAQCEDTPELNGPDIAALLVDGMRGSAKNEELIAALVSALKTCLECDGKLDFTAEQEAEAALQLAGERPNPSTYSHEI